MSSRSLALLLCLAAVPAAAVCIPTPQESWSTSTEPGVTVTCGHHKTKRIPGECAMFTIKPDGEKPWTAWASEDDSRNVRTFDRGELLVVGTSNLRLVTRTTRDKDKRTGAAAPTARLAGALSAQERARLPDECSPPGWIESIKKDGTWLVVKLAQQEKGRSLPSVEVRINTADASVKRR